MSSTNRGGQRHPDDFYATPAWCTRAILPHVLTSEARRVLDPACGEGAILDVVAGASRAMVYGLEADPARAATARGRGFDVECCDALTLPGWAADVIVMNPPFSLALEFVQRALCQRGATVAALLRLAFLASQRRAAFWRAHPADVYVLPKRPSFTGDGRSDSADYMWAVFGPGRGGRWQVLDVEAGRT